MLSSTAVATSELGGVALKLRENPDTVTVSTSTGAIKHDTGATQIDDGTYNLIDPDGYASNGLMTDGVSVLVSTPAEGFSNNYDFARVYRQGYVTGGVAYSVKGIYGIVTKTSDMPTSGSANFRGEAQGTYTNGTDSFDLNNGASIVTANFGSGTVQVQMSGFSAVDRSTGASSDVGFNAVNISGMALSGNTYSGGTITTLDGTAAVQVVGSRQQNSASGRFFGLTASGAPDETGGIGYLKGSDGSVTTIFLAD